MKSLLREPLVHFVILGVLLFFGHALWERHVTKADYTITVSTEELERQALIFAGENRRQPSDEDLKALLFAYVEEQALMREAERLGLDADDTIIRRRMAQKMRFMIEDASPPALPNEDILRSWFDDNREQFKEPQRRSFIHVYISPESHGDKAESLANTLMESVNLETWKSLGDPFILKRSFSHVSPQDVDRMFGSTFTALLFDAPEAKWHGPLPSAYGLHLVYVQDIKPELVPTFEQVKPEIESAWQEETRRKTNQARLKDVIQKYKVEIEGEE